MQVVDFKCLFTHEKLIHIFMLILIWKTCMQIRSQNASQDLIKDVSLPLLEPAKCSTFPNSLITVLIW